MSQKRKTGLKDLYQILEDVRKIRIEHVESMLARSELCSKHTENAISDRHIEGTSLLGSNLLQNLKIAQNTLRDYGHFREADALTDVLITRAQLPELGGFYFGVEWWEALNSADRAKAFPAPLRTRPEGRRGMTLSEKILSLHVIDQRDWVIASEASWAGMESTYNRLRKSGIFRNDRFWLAGDHVVDPRINSLPKVQALIDASERAKRVFKLTDYQGMNQELGSITGVFAPDILTQRFIRKRRAPRHKTATIYMKPDDDAQYVETHEIDLSKVQSFITKYPRPDDVVPVVDCEGTELDGCFIGACTTTEADLILAALVLEEGLKGGMRPSVKGKRKVVPGSMAICIEWERVQSKPAWQIARRYTDFQCRSIGHLGSAATVAASSFTMRIIDPTFLLDATDTKKCDNLRRTRDSIIPEFLTEVVEYMEPSESSSPCCEIQSKGRIIRNTDALAPAEFLIDMKTHEAAGEYCLQCTHPEFRVRVKGGFNIVVAGCGVKCVIAKSFAFIFQRNMPNLGLLGITMPEKSFHAAVEDGAEIAIDFNDSIIYIDGRAFRFNLSPMERELFHPGGIASALRMFGSNLFEAMTEGKRLGVTPDRGITEFVDPHPELQWWDGSPN
ncbi:aconitate hydratase putative Aquifex type [Aspergillus parasiticus SU-1]|uniref:Aconitate hydratase putative Aquifex type n=1 Tax=Aspergillus parasiticus (strain ATCC 56775 / NRRL 5862 / SRRC 143 / SU-1) TaxID=1403190 RepID=A0A0F0IJC4_ASPPU|nr:aconitate hydratase putative Aquifex type [Aspergillus parasiticus SU-1]